MHVFHGPLTELSCRMIHGDSAGTLRVGSRGFWFIGHDWRKFFDVIYFHKKERAHLLKILSIYGTGERH